MNGSTLNVEFLIDANRLFGARAIRELATGVVSSPLSVIRDDFLRRDPDGRPATVRNVLEWAQRMLAKNYQTEYYYKSILLKKLVLGVHSPRTIAVFSEFKTGRCRADLVLINGVGTVYEVKTGLDDLKKASRQVEEYYKCFSRVIFVVDSRHLNKAVEVLPPTTGISCINSRQQLTVLRPCTTEATHLSSRAMFSSLRRDEYEEVVGGLFPEVDLANYRDVIECIESMSAELMQAEFTRILRRRGLSSPRLADIPHLPSSLLPAAYLYKMSSREWKGLVQVLDNDVVGV